MVRVFLRCSVSVGGSSDSDRVSNDVLDKIILFS